MYFSPALKEPRWRPRAQLRRSELSVGLSDWLFDTGSLTQRLRQICPAQFRVRLLRQHWGRPLINETCALGLERQGFVWIREVQLLCREQPWVFARTLIPPSSLQGRVRRLTRLGTRPLGEVLFTDPGAARGEVEVASIHRGQRLHRRAFGDRSETADVIWGRRSVFRLDRQPLLVCEIFLPTLPMSRANHRSNA